MKNKLLSNLSYVLCVGLGLFNFIFLAFPYLSVYASYELGEGVGSSSQSAYVGGYKVMSLWGGGFGGVMSSIFQILILVFGIAMLVYGAYGIVKAFELLENDIVPENLCSKKYARYALYGYAALNVLLLIFLIIYCATQTEKVSEFGASLEVGVRLSAGIFITLVFAAAAIVADMILPEKLGGEDENAPKLNYLCSQCGKAVKKDVKFCPDCGGAVEEKLEFKKIFVCSACGKKVKQGINFCPDCGGKIEETEAEKPVEAVEEQQIEEKTE